GVFGAGWFLPFYNKLKAFLAHGKCLLWSVETPQAILAIELAFVLLLTQSHHWGCFGLSEMNWKGGYRGNGLWGKVFIDILLGFPGPSDGLRLHSIVFFSSGSGLTADSSVLTLTLAFLDFGLDFAQSFPFHAQFCHFGLVAFDHLRDALSVIFGLSLNSRYSYVGFGRFHGHLHGSAPSSPDYVPGPEEPEQAPLLPDYVPGPEDVDDDDDEEEEEPFGDDTDDEIVAEDQPYAEDASPTDQSLDYIPEFDLEADPEKDDDEDPEEDPVDYLADGGDDGDDEDESSNEDEDDDMDIEADEEEEEEHPAPADSVVVALPAADQAPSAKETEPFETDESAATPPPHPTYRVAARITIPAPVPTVVWSDAEIDRLLAISSPLTLPLSSWSSPLPQIPFPPLPLIPSPSLLLSPPLHVSSTPPASPIRSLGYRAVTIWLRAKAASTSHSLPLPLPLPIPAPTASPPLLLPSTNRRADRPKVCLLPWKRLCFTQEPRYEGGEISSTAAARPTGGCRADYGFVGTIDAEIRRLRADEVGYGIRDAWRVEALVDDRMYHYETARLLDQEALVSREAWGHLSTDLGEIRALQARDQTRAGAPEGAGSSA
ncbi:hypothetical protein Tco_0809818, partial [Tanacetum coccineum]